MRAFASLESMGYHRDRDRLLSMMGSDGWYQVQRSSLIGSLFQNIQNSWQDNVCLLGREIKLCLMSDLPGLLNTSLLNMLIAGAARAPSGESEEYDNSYYDVNSDITNTYMEQCISSNFVFSLNII